MIITVRISRFHLYHIQNMLRFCKLTFSCSNQFQQQTRTLFVSAQNEAARKGTREKARQKKVKVEVKKVAFVPHNQRRKLKVDTLNKHIDDSWKAVPKDNVYVGKYYRWAAYTVADAINCHRETHHPTMYNAPNAPLNVVVELNMQGEKATRFVDNFQRMAQVHHKFNHGEDRTILVFAKGQENVKLASEAGASLVGGPELVKDIQNGDLLITDYQYVIAHTNVLPDLVPIRGLLKKKFPNPKMGTLGPNLDELVQKFMNGIQYMAVKDENQKDFGVITTTIGTLDMDAQHLEANLKSLLLDIDTMRPKRNGKFITRVLLKSPPSAEQLKIDPFVYVPQERTLNKKEILQQQQDEEEPDLKEAVN